MSSTSATTITTTATTSSSSSSSSSSRSTIGIVTPSSSLSPSPSQEVESTGADHCLSILQKFLDVPSDVCRPRPMNKTAQRTISKYYKVCPDTTRVFRLYCKHCRAGVLLDHQFASHRHLKLERKTPNDAEIAKPAEQFKLA